MKISVVIKTQFFSFKSHALSTFLKHFQIGQDPFLNILLQEGEKKKYILLISCVRISSEFL